MLWLCLRLVLIRILGIPWNSRHGGFLLVLVNGLERTLLRQSSGLGSDIVSGVELLIISWPDEVGGWGRYLAVIFER